uniref:Uncharacterized protein n=1 Tax=Anopheles arabiensis TaxID=7173 RepID=A0A182IEZ4_ANOAR
MERGPYMNRCDYVKERMEGFWIYIIFIQIMLICLI